LRPAALRIEANKIMARPIIKAMTGFAWRGEGVCTGELVGNGGISEVVDMKRN